MNISFDKIGDFKTPTMTLHNPNGKQIDIISVHKDFSVTPHIGTLSELQFTIPFDENIRYYHKVRNKRVIRVDGIGKFRISSASDENDGVSRYKTVVAHSLECELNDVIVTILEGTYKLWNSVTPSESLIGKILEYLPNWKVGSIDDDLRDVSRTFQQVAASAYGFLMGEVSETYECMFLFNSENRTIDIKTYSGVATKTDVIAGYSNLVKKLNIEEKSDGIFTCLNVMGANELSINLVNPLGTSKIYNYKHFMDYRDEDGEKLMSDGLIASLTSWNSKVANALTSYGALLTSIKNANKELIVLKGEVTKLEGEYAALEGVYKAKYEQGLLTIDTWNQMEAKKVEISNKKTQVTNKENQLKSLMGQKTTINNNLSITNTSNFTIEQQKELALFTIEDSYVDEHFLTTDIMTNEEIQDMTQSLYDKAITVLDRVSQPTFSFSIDMVNFMLLGEYKAFTNQIKLGAMIRLEIEKGRFAYPVLLGYTINFDKENCTSVTMDFGSTLLLKSDDTTLNDLLQGAITSGNKVTIDSGKWSQYDKDKGAVNEFINGSLDASKNEIINASNQEIKINENGIIGRKYNDNGTYSPEQLWIMNNCMAYTKDSFKNIETAFGRILLPDGTWSYGLAAQAIMGKLLITSQLHLENANNSFLVNESGATLNNASFTLQTTNGKGKIILDPTNGIKVQGKTGSVFEDKFYVDTNGNVVFGGNLKGATGSFSGDLTASNLIGGTINIGNNRFKVDNLGNCTAESLKITGGTINVKDNFTVDGTGNVVANNMTIKGGNLNLNNLTMIGEINWSNLPDKVANVDDVPQLPNYIQSTKITQTTIESPAIKGGSVTGSTLHQDSGGKNYANIDIIDGYLQWYKNNAFYGSVSVDTNDYKMYIQGGKALKLETVSGGISIEAASGSKVHIGNCQFMGEVLDKNGKPIGANSVAVFG